MSAHQLLLSAEDWSFQQGPKGGHLWINRKTGHHVYSRENPGAHEAHKMPVADYHKAIGVHPESAASATISHRRDVEQALASGKEVHPEALKAHPVLQRLSDDLEDEISTRLDSIENEEGAPETTREDVIQELMQNMDDKDEIAHDYKKELEDLGVRIGVFREIKPEEMARVAVTRGKKYDFKRGGKAYVFDSWKPLIGQEPPSEPEIRMAMPSAAQPNRLEQQAIDEFRADLAAIFKEYIPGLAIALADELVPYGTPQDLSLAAEDWSFQEGPKGGHKWTNRKTGHTVYSKENPGAHEAHKMSWVQYGKAIGADMESDSDEPRYAVNKAHRHAVMEAMQAGHEPSVEALKSHGEGLIDPRKVKQSAGADKMIKSFAVHDKNGIRSVHDTWVQQGKYGVKNVYRFVVKNDNGDILNTSHWTDNKDAKKEAKDYAVAFHENKPSGASSKVPVVPSTGEHPQADVKFIQRSRHEADSWARENANKGAESLTYPEQMSVANYAGDGYDTINKILRHGEFPQYTRAISEGGIADLDGLMARSKTGSDVTVQRGIKDADVVHALKNMGVGKSTIDHGFVSTTLNSDTAGHFADRNTSSGILNIHIPAGTSAYYRGEGESELILNRGARMRLQDIRVVGDQTHFDMVLEGTGEKSPHGIERKSASLAFEDTNIDRFLVHSGDLVFPEPGNDSKATAETDSTPDAPAAGFDLSLSDEQIADILLAAEDWTQLPPGPRGGHRWQHKKTGRVVDQVKNPGAIMSAMRKMLESPSLPPVSKDTPVESATSLEPHEPIQEGGTQPYTAPGEELPQVPEGHSIKPSGQSSINKTYHVTTPEGKALFAKKPAYPKGGINFFGGKEHPKAGQYQPGQAATEIAASKILRSIGINAPEAGKIESGKEHLITTPLLNETQKLGTYLKEPANEKKVREANSQQDLTNIYTGDWLLNASDRHGGNYLVDQKGKVIPIDYGSSFFPHEETEYIEPPGHSLVTHGLVSPHMPLDKGLLQRIVKQRPQIEAQTRELATHYGDRSGKMVESMQQRLDHIESLASKEKPLVSDLPKSKVWSEYHYAGGES